MSYKQERMCRSHRRFGRCFRDDGCGTRKGGSERSAPLSASKVSLGERTTKRLIRWQCLLGVYVDGGLHPLAEHGNVWVGGWVRQDPQVDLVEVRESGHSDPLIANQGNDGKCLQQLCSQDVQWGLRSRDVRDDDVEERLVLHDPGKERKQRLGCRLQ